SSISAMQICGSLATNFSTQTVNSTNIKSTRWNFGDGQSSTELAPTHTYEKAGVYHIQLDITKADNSTEILTKDIEVVALPAKLFIKW
ncbi:MAG: hypothetical protein RIS47_544, partial [Bacteroidota bacterium]